MNKHLAILLTPQTAKVDRPNIGRGLIATLIVFLTLSLTRRQSGGRSKKPIKQPQGWSLTNPYDSEAQFDLDRKISQTLTETLAYTEKEKEIFAIKRQFTKEFPAAKDLNPYAGWDLHEYCADKAEKHQAELSRLGVSPLHGQAEAQKIYDHCYENEEEPPLVGELVYVPPTARGIEILNKAGFTEADYKGATWDKKVPIKPMIDLMSMQLHLKNMRKKSEDYD